MLADKRSLWIDARSPMQSQRWHAAGARNVPFDYLEPTCSAEVSAIAASDASQVVVFGDGKDPDSGQQLARELAGRGIRNVRFVQGGAPALEAAATGGSR
jgi:rhodanese-related sulfurtransferase